MILDRTLRSEGERKSDKYEGTAREEEVESIEMMCEKFLNKEKESEVKIKVS